MKLARLLASLSLTAPLAGCCLDDEHWRDRRVVYPATVHDAQLAMLIEACKTQQSCEPLCLYDWEDYAPDHYPEYSSEVRDCELEVKPGGESILTYEGLEPCAAGRRPHGYRRCAPYAGGRAGRFLVQQAALEDASVRAFADLHADLVAIGAPANMRRAAIAAAGDEVRHTVACVRLARRHGGTVRRAVTPPAARRTPREVALDNVVEGCVRETFGTVVAGYQACAAADPAIRATMRVIARDEARHAALAWRLHAWLAPRLSAGDRGDVVDAARAARAELRGAGTGDAELARVVGVPGVDAAHALLAALDTALWSRLTRARA